MKEVKLADSSDTTQKRRRCEEVGVAQPTVVLGASQVGDGCFEVARWWRSRSSVIAVAWPAMAARDPGERLEAWFVDEDGDRRLERGGVHRDGAWRMLAERGCYQRKREMESGLR